MSYAGQPLKRFEDPKLVTGRGSYVGAGGRTEEFSEAGPEQQSLTPRGVHATIALNLLPLEWKEHRLVCVGGDAEPHIYARTGGGSRRRACRSSAP